MACTTPSKSSSVFAVLAFAAACLFASAVARAGEHAWRPLSARDDKAIIDALAKRVEQLERRLRAYQTAPGAQERDIARRVTVMPTSDSALLYQAALADFAADRPALARRALALLIKRHPDSPQAGAARRRLAGANNPRALAERPQPLQRRPVRIQPASAPADPASPVHMQAPAKLAPVAVAGFTADKTPAAPGWKADVRRTHDLSRDFKLTAGDRIFFPDGGAAIGARAKTVLMAQAAWLKRHAKAYMRLEGHADDLGTRDYNRQLARWRVQAVRARLMQFGVARDRLRVATYGDTQRIAICPSAECKAHNRRVVAVVESAASRGRARRGADARSKATLHRVGGTLSPTDSR